MARRILCWDFDHTLFGVQRAAQDASHTPRQGEFAGYGVRQGMEPALARES